MFLLFWLEIGIEALLTKAFSSSSSSKGRNDPKTARQSRKDGGKAFFPNDRIHGFIAQTRPKSSVFTPSCLRRACKAQPRVFIACARAVAGGGRVCRALSLALHLSVLTAVISCRQNISATRLTRCVMKCLTRRSLHDWITSEDRFGPRHSVARWFLQVRHGSVVSATRFCTKSGRNGQLLGGSYSVENNELQAEK